MRFSQIFGWVFKSIFAAMVIAVIYLAIFPPGGRNTEQVCFNKGGEVIFYAAGFKPSETPVIHVTGDKYKNVQTGEMVIGDCRSSWGVEKPKGRDYWTANG